MTPMKLSAPVGVKPRQSVGKPVVNNAKDVLIVQQMMRANGFNVRENGKVDSGLLKAIGAFQTKSKLDVDQVVDPTGQTIAALKPKYTAFLKELDKEKFHVLKLNGKTVHVPAAVYKKEKAKILKYAQGYAEIFAASQDTYSNIALDLHDAAQLKDGLLAAVSNLVIVTAGRVTMPNPSIVKRSGDAVVKLFSAIKSGDLAKVQKQIIATENALDKTHIELARYYKEYSRSALATGTVLKVSTTAGFAVLGSVAAAPVAAATGLSLMSAGIITAGGAAALESSSQEFGKYLSNQGTSVYDSVITVAIDGTVGSITGAIGGKFPTKFLDDMAGALAKKFAPKVSFLTVKTAQEILKNYLAGAGHGFITEGLGQVVKAIGTKVKSGKAPTQKEFEAAIFDILFKTLTGGIFKNFEAAAKGLKPKVQSMLIKDLVPAAYQKVVGKVNVDPKVQKEIYTAVANSMSENAMKSGYDAAIIIGTEGKSSSQMISGSLDQIKKDKTLKTQLERAIMNEMKKRKIKI